MRLLLLAPAIAVGATAVPATAQEAPGLAPSMRWTLDYADDSCALRRVFGEGSNRILLELRRFGPDPSLQTLIGSARMAARNPANVRYRFGETAEWQEAYGYSLTMRDGFRSGVLFTARLWSRPESEATDAGSQPSSEWRSSEEAAAAQVSTLYVRGAFGREVVLQLEPMDAAMSAMNRCIDELMTHWNIDVEAHKTLTRRAIPIDPESAARMVSYPPKMVAQRMPGLVNVRLSIDDTGRVTDCHIQMPLSDPEFAESSCADIQHAYEFEPALDRDGKPIASFYVTRVMFLLN